MRRVLEWTGERIQGYGGDPDQIFILVRLSHTLPHPHTNASLVSRATARVHTSLS